MPKVALPRGPGCLAPDEVHLWRWQLGASDSDWDEAWLTSEERARAARYRFDVPRRRFVAARSGLRQILSRYLGTEVPRAFPFALGPHGKPALALAEQQWLRFNLTHTGDQALCAICREREVGVDVECVDGSRTPTSAMRYAARHFCSPAEWQFLDQGFLDAEHAFADAEHALADAEHALADAEHALADAEYAFLTLWTCKEAIGKARGTGLMPPISTLDAVLGGSPDMPPSGRAGLPEAWQQREGDGIWWVTRIVPFPGTVGAVAVEMPDEHAKPKSPLIWFDLHPLVYQATGTL